ncbi:MAG: hypothetical protein LBC41_09790 [Clostridiales bacterium]|jgi:hypothetical protein|nr:hypothetical protein [Clostridiales bacterium]MDR2750941.1 hypothetical protein [Clostridiales bacterium]
MQSGTYGKGAVNMLYSNVRIRQASFSDSGQSLWLRVIYAQREYKDIIYSDVRHSQITEQHAGTEILYAQEVPVLSLKNLPSMQETREALLIEMGIELDEMLALAQEKYKVFLHYVKPGQTLAVIAKKLFVGRECATSESVSLEIE